MLKSIVKLAALLRQTPECIAWRTAWKDICSLSPDMPDLNGENIEFTPEVILSILCTSETVEARPVMLPFLMARHPVVQNYPDFIKSLSNNTSLLKQYDLLVKQFVFFILVIGYIRSITPGYPHEDLIFNLAGSPWMDLSNIKEVPLGIEKELFKRTNGNLLREIGTYIPSSPGIVRKALSDISSDLQNESSFKKLDQAVKNINKNKNLKTELINSKKLFEKRLDKILKLQEPPYIRNNKVSKLALQIYKKNGGKVLEYVNAYLEFEELVEKIYWLLTQFMVRGKISCLSIMEETQLQQVMLGNSITPMLTGMSHTSSRSLAIGQLVCLSLSDTDHQLSGLYQVNHIQSLYKAGYDMRHYFKAQLVWQTTLKSFENILESYNIQDLLIKNEPRTSPSSFKLEVSSPQGDPISLELGDPVLDLSFSKTMFLPY